MGKAAFTRNLSSREKTAGAGANGDGGYSFRPVQGEIARPHTTLAFQRREQRTPDAGRQGATAQKHRKEKDRVTRENGESETLVTRSSLCRRSTRGEFPTFLVLRCSPSPPTLSETGRLSASSALPRPARIRRTSPVGASPASKSSFGFLSRPPLCALCFLSSPHFPHLSSSVRPAYPNGVNEPKTAVDVRSCVCVCLRAPQETAFLRPCFFPFFTLAFPRIRSPGTALALSVCVPSPPAQHFLFSRVMFISVRFAQAA